MINVADIVNDPDLGAQPYTIYRRTGGAFVAGGYTETEQVLQGYGVVQPSSAKELQQVPEGDRVEGAMTFWSTTPLYATSKDRGATSDQIEWNGERYRLYQLMPWTDAGYCKAIGMRMKGN